MKDEHNLAKRIRRIILNRGEKKSVRQPYGGEKMVLLEKPVENTGWNTVTVWHEGQRGKQGHVTQALVASERT